MAENQELLVDKPVSDPQRDRLGYAPFAKQLANTIMRTPHSLELVYAIFGPWGAGKSTLLQFVEHYLQDLPENERPVIVHFNPWWFSGREDLTRRFLGQLRSTFTPRWQSVGRQVADKLAELADVLSDVPVQQAKLLGVLPRLWKGASSSKDVPQIKGEIARLLQTQNQRILVVVDDIDRLTPDEIRDLFRTIKVVADFPNVAYLLAFDTRVVVDALTTEGVSGDKYLEKIVQVSFELPQPDQLSLQALLTERLNAIFAGTPQYLFDTHYWMNVYYDGLRHFIRTPRNVIHLANAVSTTYSAVKGEVNAVDFIAIQTCRVFVPVLYAVIRANESLFTGKPPRDSGEQEIEQQFHDAWLQQLPPADRDTAKRLMCRVFPRVGAVWSTQAMPVGWERDWRRECRICSSDKFAIYFWLSVPEGNISHAEMVAILSLANDTTAFGRKLVSLAQEKHSDGTSRVRQVLEELLDYDFDTPRLRIFPVVCAFLDIGDKLLRPEDVAPGLVDLGGNGEKMELIIELLLTPISEGERFTVLNQALAGAHSPGMVVRTLTRLEEKDKGFLGENPTPEEKRFLSIDHLALLKDSALRVIRQASTTGDLLTCPDLPSVLRAWTEWEADAEEHTWVQSVTQNDHNLITFLRQFVHVGFEQQEYDVGVTRVHWLDPQEMAPYLDVSEMSKRVTQLAATGIAVESEQTILEMFMRGYTLRQQGQDPSYVPLRPEDDIVFP